MGVTKFSLQTRQRGEPSGSVRHGATDWPGAAMGIELLENIERRMPSLTRRVAGSVTGLVPRRYAAFPQTAAGYRHLANATLIFGINRLFFRGRILSITVSGMR